MNNDMNSNSNNLINASKVLGTGRYSDGSLVSYATIHDMNAIRLAVAVPIAGLCFAIYWLSGAIKNYAAFDFPYNIIAAFYHYFFNLPIQSVGLVWRWLKLLELTPYPNLNLIFSLIGIAFYSLFVLSIYAYIAKTISEKFEDSAGFAAITIGPAIIAFLWFVAVLILSWVF
ncbi:hypothetical protein [Psychrobacter sp. UBA3480]|uniref:hypothetical protein n=1 Tax=Psychrobacter sp. UBA3480 TaxID=1947350 RepID=UPI0025D923A4|nr:hypothetical protein [Psychrobacter sp. UBA3480]